MPGLTYPRGSWGGVNIDHVDSKYTYFQGAHINTTLLLSNNVEPRQIITYIPLKQRVRVAEDCSSTLDFQGCESEQVLKRLDQEGLKDAVKQGLVYFEREERDLHMLLFPEVLDQVSV